MSDRTITDYDIQALVDGELDGQAREDVIARIQTSPRLLARYNELREQKELLRRWWSSGEGYQS